MNNSSLISLLKNFNKQQLKEFNGFIKSPYFNTNKALITLFEYIRKQHPEFTKEKLEKQFVFKKLFGKTQYNDGFFRVIMSNLQNLAEEFLSVESFRRNSILKKKFLLDSLMEMPGSRKLSEKILKEGLNEAGKIVPSGPDDFLEKYHMAFYRKYLFSTSFTASKSHKPDESMFDEQKYLTYYYLLRMLADHFYHLNQSQIINYTPRLVFIDEITGFLEKNPDYLEFPTLNMAYLRVLLLKNNNIEDLYKLKKAFYSTYKELGQKDNFNIISIIINFCHKNYFLTEDIKFLEEKLEILLFGLNNGINSFETDDYFDTNRFNNIFSTLLEFERIEEAESFINQYTEKLDPEDRNFWVNYSAAELKSKQGKFDEALEHLSKIKNIKIISYKFSLKSLQLKLYYEAGYIEQAVSAADSFRHFIQKESLMNPVFNEQNKNFHAYYTKLLGISYGKSSKGAGDLKENLMQVKNILHKKWLMKRIEAIEAI
ncbi:MAG TPA: hypothetical protein PK605_05565 [Ignavibacteria bacterium]|nr:hypothetical protein [Bacteroidota bacterium]HRE09239.1 hypothetical protein [Ignavibacteria bacterium]HRF66201.1 hypothetical protein [Ignavibacteria bacterium]HRJ03853.1 hypothetical protein [Ignavibacteria bacterium]